MKKKIGLTTISALVVALFFIIAAHTVHAATTFEGTVDINTASVEQLMELPGIGPAKAKAIVEYRSTNPFKTVEELKEVKGIGDKLFAKLSPHLTVSGQKPGGGAKARK